MTSDFSFSDQEFDQLNTCLGNSSPKRKSPEPESKDSEGKSEIPDERPLKKPRQTKEKKDGKRQQQRVSSVREGLDELSPPLDDLETPTAQQIVQAHLQGHSPSLATMLRCLDRLWIEKFPQFDNNNNNVLRDNNGDEEEEQEDGKKGKSHEKKNASIISAALRHLRLESGQINPSDVSVGFLTEISTLASLHTLLQEALKRDGNPEIKRTECHQRITRLMKAVHNSKMLLLFLISIREDDQALPSDVDQGEINHLVFRPFVQEITEKNAKVLAHCLEQFFLHRYRRKDEMVHRQIMYKNKIGTHAWEPYMKMDAFIQRSCNKHTEYQQWLALRSGPPVLKGTVEVMTKGVEAELIDLKPDRTVTAWSNGLYFAAEDKFVAYDSPAFAKISPEVVACKKFDCEMDTTDISDEKMDFFELIDSIIKETLTFQKFSSVEQKWILGLCGRCIYPLDNLEVVIFCLGPAGVGKSTLLNGVAQFFAEEDVGSITNEIETVFGLQGLHDKFLNIATDLKAKSRFSAGWFQLMASREKISIAIKNKTAISKPWTSHTALGGNEIPSNFVDMNDNIVRRLFLIDYTMVPKTRDKTLAERLKQNFGQFYRLCNISWLWLQQELEGQDFWKCCPKRFITNQDFVRHQGNPIQAFLGNKSICEFSPNKQLYYCPLNLFYKKFKAYCQIRGMSGVRVDDALLTQLLKRYHAEIDYTKRPWPMEKGTVRHDQFILGMVLRSLQRQNSEPKPIGNRPLPTDDSDEY